MKTLLVLRHAKSSWNDPELSDHDRPLNNRGWQDAPRMGDLLRFEELLPDIILTSSAKRAVMTAKLLIESSGYEGELLISRDLYAHYPEAYIEQLQDLDICYECAMVIGHNPGVEELVEMLTGEYSRMPTAALAHIQMPIDRWVDLGESEQGKLVNIWRPKELSGISRLSP